MHTPEPTSAFRRWTSRQIKILTLATRNRCASFAPTTSVAQLKKTTCSFHKTATTSCFRVMTTRKSKVKTPKQFQLQSPLTSAKRCVWPKHHSSAGRLNTQLLHSSAFCRKLTKTKSMKPLSLLPLMESHTTSSNGLTTTKKNSARVPTRTICFHPRRRKLSSSARRPVGTSRLAPCFCTAPSRSLAKRTPKTARVRRQQTLTSSCSNETAHLEVKCVKSQTKAGTTKHNSM